MLRISPEWEAAIAKPRREAHLDGTSSPVPIVPWLAPSLHPELRELLARLGSVRRLAAGENVINPEEPVSSLVLVTRGVTGRSVGSPDGQSSEAIAVSTPGSRAHCRGQPQLFHAPARIRPVLCPHAMRNRELPERLAAAHHHAGRAPSRPCRPPIRGLHALGPPWFRLHRAAWRGNAVQSARVCLGGELWPRAQSGRG